ncbi:disease resistance protein RUN1-like [Eucalyptus grandis]|uniref:disease resistance protein RUN1-like n=1 Tax=Eucalyptus grandis TaxID=71139 RepID=UPI00192ECD95|nr:disease resistance protein RUN1-like [Eucalyptus grandis]
MAKTKLNRGGTGAGSHSGDGRREREAAERAASRGRRCGNSGAAVSKQLVAAPSGDAGRCFCFCCSVLFEPEEGEGRTAGRQHGGGLGFASSSGACGRATMTARGDDCSSVFVGLRDNEEIRQGEKIGDELLHAIKSSKIYVPIFSRDYASSAWCLRELEHMVECLGKAKDKMILPIFYDVDPDDVKLRTRLYLDSLEKHEGKFGCDVLQWKEALTEVAKIRGLSLKNRGHGEIINAIMDKVVTKLMKRRRNLPDYLVGIHDQVEAIVDLLNEGSCDFRYLVIHGMGGIGKTTLASAVFNRISNQFEGYSFLSDVRESAQRGRIIDLQKQLLSEILQGRSPEIHSSIDVGINIIRERFCHKKVLLVIDDVDKWDQLSKLAGKSDWFGPGSKIIITTRDINFLPIKEEEEGSFQAHCKEFEIYDMKEMDSYDAFQLFSQHALGMDFPPPHYEDISRKITYKTGGLPLALEVIGSSLFGKNKTIWKDTLKKLHSMPKQEVFVKLKISYDMLDDAQRDIFLDIACYFIGKDRLHPFYMWKASGYFPKTDLLVLTRMSLIKIEEDDTLWMHDHLRDLGREIIRLEDNDPGKRSRLWMPDNVLNVVQRKQVSDKIVALTLTGDSKGRNFTNEEFSKLPNLRFLELEGGNLVGDFKNLLSKLAWFSWTHFPSKLKVKNLRLEKLVVLELSRGDLGDWAEWEQCMVSNNLKVIHINDGENLHRTPDFSKLPFALGGLRSLSTLYIEYMNVEDIHHSIGEMMHLKYLSFNNCLLRKVPNSIEKLSLVELDLSMTKIIELPHCIGDLKKLTKLSLQGTLIKKLPNSIGELESLIELDLAYLDIAELPTCIGNLKKLEGLYLQGSAIRELSKTIGMLENLKELDASLCGNLEGEIPNEIGALSFLRMLNLCHSQIRRLPTSMNQLSHLQQLNLNQCEELEQISELPMSLKYLDLPSHLLWTVTNLSYLTNLVQLRMSRGTPQLSEFGDGAPNIEWIKGLSKLEDLSFHVKDVLFSLNDLATLSRLQHLKMTWINRSLIAPPSSLSSLALFNLRSPEVILDDVRGEQLEKPIILGVWNSELLERLLGFPSLKGLEILSVTYCRG